MSSLCNNSNHENIFEEILLNKEFKFSLLKKIKILLFHK